jgi:hypothetical protein
MKPSYMIAESKLSILEFYSRALRGSVLAFLKDITRACRDFPVFQIISTPGAESEFIRYLIGAPYNRSFNNLVVFNV